MQYIFTLINKYIYPKHYLKYILIEIEVYKKHNTLRDTIGIGFHIS